MQDCRLSGACSHGRYYETAPVAVKQNVLLPSQNENMCVHKKYIYIYIFICLFIYIHMYIIFT